MKQRRAHRVGSSSLVLGFGDLLESEAEVLVSSDDSWLSMGGGVSGAIAARAGRSIEVDAAKALPLSLGDVVVTTAGALPARHVFHVVTIGPPPDGTPEPNALDLISTAVDRCLELAQVMNLRSIAFPALGAGVARLPIEEVAVRLVGAVVERLRASTLEIVVEIHLQPKSWQSELDYLAFFEQIAAALPSAPIVEPSSTRGDEPPTELESTQRRVLALEAELVGLEQRLGKEGRSAADDVALKDHYVKVTNDLHSVLAERQPIQIFVSYSRADSELASEFLQHLAPLRREGLASWIDRQIEPGATWEEEIAEALRTAKVFVALISPAFLASEYCTGVEWDLAMQRRAAGNLTIVPVILRPSMWESLVGDIQVLPVDGQPIASATDRDHAFLGAVRAIQGIARSLRAT